MIEGVLFSRTLSAQEANRLVRKIEERLWDRAACLSGGST